MGNITFIEHNGNQHPVDIEEGKSLMKIAIESAVPGIDADCGGQCGCGTCHVIIDDNWFNNTGNITEEETLILDMTPEKADTSRLSCQISTTEAMDGMLVRLPEFQM